MNRLKRIAFAIIAIAMISLPAIAQKNDNGADRQRWRKEMRQLKNDFMVRELKLTNDQREKFLPAYNAMEDEIDAVNRDTRKMTREVEKKGDAATELEYEKATDAMFEAKAREGAIEKKYVKQFRSVLSREQMFKLKRVEQKFTRELMKHHNDNGGSKARNAKKHSK